MNMNIHLNTYTCVRKKGSRIKTRARFNLYPSLPVIFLSFQPVNRFESDVFSLQNHLLRIEDKGWLDSILGTRLIEHKERKVEREGRAG